MEIVLGVIVRQLSWVFSFFFNNAVYTGLDLTNLTKLFCYYLKTHRVLKICLEILRFKNSLFITPNIIITYFLEIMDTMGIVTNLSAIPFPMYILLACNDVTLFSDESFILKGTNHSIVLLLCVFVFNVQMFLITSKKQLEHICLNNVFFSKQRNQVEILKFRNIFSLFFYHKNFQKMKGHFSHYFLGKKAPENNRKERGSNDNDQFLKTWRHRMLGKCPTVIHPIRVPGVLFALCLFIILPE